MKEINSITLEIISNGITSIAEQMGVILAKTGYSTNIKERKDLSVAVFSPEGKLLSLAQHIPLHFSSLSGAVEVLTEKYKTEISTMVMCLLPMTPIPVAALICRTLFC